MFKSQDIIIKPIEDLYNGNTILAPVKNGLGFSVKPGEEEPLIVIKEESIEILGHIIDESYGSFEGFIDYLRDYKKAEEELKKYRATFVRLQNYIEEQIRASMFLRDHIDGVEHLSRDEKIYREIRDMIQYVDICKEEK